MARNSSSRNNNNNKKKKNSQKKTKKSTRTEKPKSSTTAAKSSLPGTTSRAPPWKVLSAKEAKKNAQKEKKRRQLIKDGKDVNIVVDEEDASQELSKNMLTEADRLLLKWKRFSSTQTMSLNFVGAYLEKRLPPRCGVPEVAFLGRSNVGKSSLLNKLCGSDEARVGKTPGATASVNLYLLENAKNNKPLLGMADLPGFGYAKLSKETKEAVQQAAERYLEKRIELALCILLVDIRRVPSDDDRAVLAALYDMGLPILVVATKVDKVSSTELEAQLQVINEGLGLPDGQPLCVSAVTGQGIKKLWQIVMEACETRVTEFEQETIKTGTAKEEGIQDEGLLLQTENEDDLVAYDQGYDWIHASSEDEVFYEEEDGDDADIWGGGDEDSSEWKMAKNEQQQADARDALKFKNLKKIVRNMERSGEV